MLEKLFESLDEKVFTPEMKKSLEAQFNEAVELKSAMIAEDKIEAEIDKLQEKSEEHITMLEEKAEEFVTMKQDEMLESVDKYLERVVDEFIVEAQTSLDDSLKAEKADMIIECFDAALTATGVEVSKIVEAKEATEDASALEESIVKYDALVEENIALKEEATTLLKMGIISEMKESLTLVEADKFAKLAELVEFSKDEAYGNKLEVIVESIKGAAKPTKEVINEDVKDDAKAPIWAHLV